MCVCDLGSVSAAARRLGVAQSTVSAAISSFEEELGAALFRPSALGMRATAVGGRLRKFAAPLLLDVELACLDLHVGRVSHGETVPVRLRGIPVGSLIHSAVMQGIVQQARQTSGVGARLYPDGEETSSEAPNRGLLIRYGLAARNGGSDAGSAIAIPDRWVLLSLSEPEDSLLAPNAIKPSDLSRLRLLVPAFGREFTDAMAERMAGLRPLVVPFDEAGAPFTLLSRQDASLLMPAGCLPPGFRHPGLIVRQVEDGMIAPTVLVDCSDDRRWGEQCIERAICGEISNALSDRPSDAADTDADASLDPDWFWLRHGIDLPTLNCFSAAVDTGSITRAAKVCHIVQPALSTQIRKLEKELARTLLERTARGVRPTPAGRRLYDLVHPLLQDAISTTEQLAEPARTIRALRIGVLPALNEESLIASIMERAIVAWQARRPDVPLSISEAYSGVLRRWLRNQLIEVALLDNRDEEASLVLNVIMTEPMTLVHARGHGGLPDCGPIRAADVLQTSLAMPSRRFGLRALAERSFAAHGLVLAPKLELDSLATTVRLVRSGPWTTILPASAIQQQINSGLIAANEIVEPTIERNLVIARRAGEPLSSHARELVRVLVDRIANPVPAQ